MKNKLKKMVLPLSVVGMLAIGSTSVFASEVDKSDNSNNMTETFRFEYDKEVEINNMDDAKGGSFIPSYTYGKIWFKNETNKGVTVTILKDGKGVKTLSISPNSSNDTRYNFKAEDTYTYSVTAVDGSVVPKGKLVIKTAESEVELGK